MKHLTYQICTRCIMDTSDPEIIFDSSGVCNHCRRFDLRAPYLIFSDEKREKQLVTLVKKIKAAGKGQQYNCVIGISGGVDSTYLAYQVKMLGLNPIAVHLDNGWNSELSVANIESVVKKLGIDLYTRVLDWEDFRDLQVSFLKASTPDSEIPTDHAIYGLLLEVASRENVRFILTGTNVNTESVMPRAWSHGHRDWKYIQQVHRRFGTRKSALQNYPHYGILDFAFYRLIKGIRLVSFLNFLKYDKDNAIAVIQKELGWRNYGGKHYESIYTKFYQGYLLPTKFGFDKRRAHLSSLILSQQMSRETALKEIAKDPYPSADLKLDLEFVKKKLNLTDNDFETILHKPKASFSDYPSYEKSLAYRLIFRTAEKLKYR